MLTTRKNIPIYKLADKLFLPRKFAV